MIKREMSHKVVSEILSQTPFPDFTLAVKSYWEVWKSIDTQIKKIEQKLKEQAAVDPHETIYRSAPGIGPLSARILSNELSDFIRERAKKRLLWLWLVS